MMKVVAVVESLVIHGGGYNQSISSLQQLGSICRDKYDLLVVTTHQDNVIPIADLGFNVVFARISLLDRLVSLLRKSWWWPSLQSRLKYVPPFEREVVKHGGNLCYFLSPSRLATSLQTLNYIVTVWDLCHQTHPEFPEVRAFGEFYAREELYSALIPGAYAVIADSDELANHICSHYGVSYTRLVAMPFSPSPFVGAYDEFNSSLKNLIRSDFFYFYPAQYWAHKNHMRILEALSLLKAKGIQRHFVFCGGDKGGRSHLESTAVHLGVSENVSFLGFVSNEELNFLYRQCKAVVMPTYFGPTNLPPLEAWFHGKPLIYSAHLGGQSLGAALLVDSDDPEELAVALESVLSPDVSEKLVAAGKARLDDLSKSRQAAEEKLGDLLLRFSRRLHCWMQ